MRRISDWEEVAYSIDEEQSQWMKDSAKNIKWKFEEVAYTMEDSSEERKTTLTVTMPKLKITHLPCAGKISFTLTPPKLESTPERVPLRIRLGDRFHKWMVKQVLKSGHWVVYRRPTKFGDGWKIFDQKRMIEHSSGLVIPRGEGSWWVFF